MTKPMLPRLGAACGIVFPIAMFLAVGNGSNFAPWRAIAATWALVLALPFLAYLYSLLRAAEGDGGWLSTTALVAGVSGILLKLTSHAPELAIHRERDHQGHPAVQGTRQHRGCSHPRQPLPARHLLRSRRRDRARARTSSHAGSASSPQSPRSRSPSTPASSTPASCPRCCSSCSGRSLTSIVLLRRSPTTLPEPVASEHDLLHHEVHALAADR